MGDSSTPNTDKLEELVESGALRYHQHIYIVLEYKQTDDTLLATKLHCSECGAEKTV